MTARIDWKAVAQKAIAAGQLRPPENPLDEKGVDRLCRRMVKERYRERMKSHHAKAK